MPKSKKEITSEYEQGVKDTINMVSGHMFSTLFVHEPNISYHDIEEKMKFLVEEAKKLVNTHETSNLSTKS